jgi:hypothetical protein
MGSKRHEIPNHLSPKGKDKSGMFFDDFYDLINDGI